MSSIANICLFVQWESYMSLFILSMSIPSHCTTGRDGTPWYIPGSPDCPSHPTVPWEEMGHHRYIPGSPECPSHPTVPWEGMGQVWDVLGSPTAHPSGSPHCPSHPTIPWKGISTSQAVLTNLNTMSIWFNEVHVCWVPIICNTSDLNFYMMRLIASHHTA